MTVAQIHQVCRSGSATPTFSSAVSPHLERAFFMRCGASAGISGRHLHKAPRAHRRRCTLTCAAPAIGAHVLPARCMQERGYSDEYLITRIRKALPLIDTPLLITPPVERCDFEEHVCPVRVARRLQGQVTSSIPRRVRQSFSGAVTRSSVLRQLCRNSSEVDLRRTACGPVERVAVGLGPHDNSEVVRKDEHRGRGLRY